MKIGYCLVIVALSVALAVSQEEGEGERRLRKLRQMEETSGGIITFNSEDYNQFAMQYPRPYSLVIYFTGVSCKLCDSLKGQYEYMATLYNQQGATKSAKKPVFFVVMTFNRDTQSVFDVYGFKSIPNLVVSKPEMPLVSEIEKKLYIQKYKWAISYSDGDVTTHKMLDFVNARTSHNVMYKPTFKTMLTMFFGFISITALGVVIYTKLKWIWTYWGVWFVGVLAIYITCVSGVVYDIIHDVPFVGRNKDTGEAVIFTGGTREQYGAEGLIVSLTISLIGLLFVSIVLATEQVKDRYKVRVWSIVAIVLIVMLTGGLESIYKSKSWYGPSFYPPNDYSHGSIATDQGNNI